MMASVFKRGGQKNRNGWYYAAFLDHSGRRKTVCTRTADKAVAERIAKKWEAEAMLRRAGVIDPAMEGISDQAHRLIESHLIDYESRMKTANRAPQYISSTLGCIRAIVKSEGWIEAT